MDNFDKIKRKEKTKSHVGDRIIKTKTTYEPQDNGEVKVTKKTVDRPDWNTSHVSSILGFDRTRRKEIYYQSPDEKKESEKEKRDMTNSLNDMKEKAVNEMKEGRSNEDIKADWEARQNEIKKSKDNFYYKKVGEGKVEKVAKEKNSNN